MNIQHQHFEYGNPRLLIFMPSRRSRKIYPYYPRISWVDQIKESFDSLYIADPHQDKELYQEAGGSWFFDEEGNSDLPRVAGLIEEIRAHKRYREVIVCGSSMGGYAGIVLGSLLRDVAIIAECPQIFLEKHPDSNTVLKKIPVKNKHLIDLTKLIQNDLITSKIKIVCNITDHHFKTHIFPVMSMLAAPPPQTAHTKTTILEFMFYANDKYKNGHTALNFEDFYKIVANL